MFKQTSSRIGHRIRHVGRHFVTDRRGNVALLFGLSATVLFMAMGGGLDFARAYLARQKLSQIATLACQYASRPAIIGTSTSTYGGSNGSAAYVSNVNNFIATTWQTQKVNLVQTNAAPFTYTPGGAANVSLTSSMPAIFIQMFGINTVGLGAQSHCYDSASTVPQGGGQYVMKEGFEATPNGAVPTWTAYLPNGSSGFQQTPTTFSTAVGYTGSDGTQWHITGYCLEQDRIGTINNAVFEGNYSVELDCDDGSGRRGNSSITTQLSYLSAGTYELRYAYRSRVGYSNYDPTYLCGSSASDLSWANDGTVYNGNSYTGTRSNQLNVYFDQNNPTTNKPPTHTTIDGTQTLDGSNLIDMCLYGPNWVQRSVSINVTTAGYYWLSFAADGSNDTLGGQLDNVQFCRISCPGSVQDNFPSTWLPSGKVLFEDTFDNMTIKANYGLYSDVDISTSNGTSGTPSSGWPNTGPSGWRISEVNQMSNGYYQPAQGTAFIELDADRNVSGVANSNRTITRRFLLDPGYYQVSYYFRSNATFASLGSTVYCGATPTAANMSALTGTGTTTLTYSGGGTYTMALDTNTVGVFMSHDLLASDPNYVGWKGVASYANPDGTTTWSPTVPDNTVSMTNYNAAQVNPLLDICGYAASWQTRTASIFIKKAGYYWLTFAALGTSDNVGGATDDVKFIALGSPYMASPPASPVSIPAPNPQPGSTIYYTGFSITADPLAP
jgi:hypothetical protein